MAKEKRYQVANLVLAYLKMLDERSYTDAVLENTVYVVSPLYALEIEIRKAKEEHVIVITKVEDSKFVGYVEARQKTEYAWVSKGSIDTVKRMTQDIISVLKEIM